MQSAQKTAKRSINFIEGQMNNHFLEKLPNKYEILYGFLHSTINGVLLVDATVTDRPILYANQVFTEITGYRGDEIIGKSSMLLRKGNRDPEIIGFIDSKIQLGEEFDVESTYAKKDGSPLFCNVIGTPVFNEHGRLSYYTYIVRDLSDRIVMENLKCELQEESKLLEEYKDAIDESSIVSKTDKAGIITYVNDEFCRISGHTREELIGKPHIIVRHPDMPKEAFATLWETILDKRVWKGVVKNKKKDGSAYYVNATVKPILNAAGEIVEFISIRSDITEQIIAKEEAQKALESKNGFFARASHELRTPLNAIINFTEMVLDDYDDICHDKDLKAEAGDFLNRVLKNSKHLLGIINDILEISKVEQKRTEMAPTQICHIMQDAINAVKSLAYKKFIDIDMECPNEQAIIFANEKYLFQVLLNLLSNSIKFTEPKGRVYIGVKPKAEFVEIYVTDTGRGIPKEKIDSIFDAFVQAAEGDEGTGLGLKIVKEMCESMNIDIKLESEVGIGTTFRLFARRF